MIEVLKQMVEALEWCHGGEPIGTASAIQAGKKLIAELESQKPMLLIQSHRDDYWCDDLTCRKCYAADFRFKHFPPQRTEQEQEQEPVADDFFKMIADRNPKPFPPSQRTFVGLTENDRILIKHDANFNQFMTAGEYADRVQQLTEARLKDKNI
jgi:hypothetical protein